jgi:uncharacterized protein (DUF4213/DUF364 family)
MQILNDIINSLTNDYPVKEVRTCTYWTMVVSRNAGLASTIRDECPSEHDNLVNDARNNAVRRSRPLLFALPAPSYRGLPLSVGGLTQKSAKELSCYVQSDKLLEATIGMAAINSLIEFDESECVELNASAIIAKKGQNKNIAVIGHFPFIGKLKSIARKLWVIEKKPISDDLPEEMATEILPEADVIALSATTLINHTLEKLLALCKQDSFKVMLGPTSPMSEVLFDYGIDVISGVKVFDTETVLRYISEGATFRQVQGVKLLSMVKPHHNNIVK